MVWHFLEIENALMWFFQEFVIDTMDVDWYNGSCFYESFHFRAEKVVLFRGLWLTLLSNLQRGQTLRLAWGWVSILRPVTIFRFSALYLRSNRFPGRGGVSILCPLPLRKTVLLHTFLSKLIFRPENWPKAWDTPNFFGNWIKKAFQKIF